MNVTYSEIQEIPAALARGLADGPARFAAFAAALRARNVDNLMLLARGTSAHATLYATYLLGSLMPIPVHVVQPSLVGFLRSQPFSAHSALIAVSQSGSSPDLVEIVRQARREQATTLALTNTPDSPLAAQAEFSLDIQAGPELGLAATKTYANQLLAFAQLGLHLAAEPPADTLSDLPAAVETVLALDRHIESLAGELIHQQTLLVVGRGFHHATSREAALKLQELTYTYALPFTSADFIHGPMALMDDDATVICVDAHGQANAHFAEIAERARAARARLIAVTHNPDRWPQADRVLTIPAVAQVPDWLTPITCIPVFQLLAMHLGAARGLNVDQPRYLAKRTLTA